MKTTIMLLGNLAILAGCAGADTGKHYDDPPVMPSITTWALSVVMCVASELG